ncbi:DUF302 domain-containing protein [Aestuariivirga sp.]|uniref:DUF302 domain-containing protein n=1 Tax=Aestuariivirga sp. TaxID=2650926 RepID=UPI003918DA72
MKEYYFATEFRMSFNQAEKTVLSALSNRGFGVLTSIDVQDTLRGKLGVETPPYKIFGACNPQLARKALEAEPRIGTMLPCNVILRETGDGRVEVAAIDPVASMQAIDNPSLTGIAHEVRALLQAVIHDLSGHAQREASPQAPEDDLIDAASEYSFPASDPPSYMGGAAVAGPPPEEQDKTREPVTRAPSAPEEVKPTKDCP